MALQMLQDIQMELDVIVGKMRERRERLQAQANALAEKPSDVNNQESTTTQPHASQRGKKRRRLISPLGDTSVEGMQSQLPAEEDQPPGRVLDESAHATRVNVQTADPITQTMVETTSHASSACKPNSSGSEVGLEQNAPETEADLAVRSRSELVSLANAFGATGITGVDFQSNRPVIIHIDQVPGSVCCLALQQLQDLNCIGPSVASKAWRRETCLRVYDQVSRSKYSPIAQGFAACQNCTNTGNLCVGVYKDAQGELLMQIRSLVVQFRNGATLSELAAWARQPENGKLKTTSYKAWRS
ncbi:hypothetical protein KC345_g2311 [Hortaea werneckii]|nr:hypothetical protein KC345_g2311 [Hortaea werneckii]